jgi:hypothetical protein
MPTPSTVIRKALLTAALAAEEQDEHELIRMLSA